MSVEDKLANGEVTFALAILKPGTVSDGAEFSRIETALRVMFPDASIILLAEDDEPATCRRRQELAYFMKNAACKVIPSWRITLN